MNRFVGLALLLPLAAESPPLPAEVVARSAQYVGTTVEWTGRQMRTSRIPPQGPINGRIFQLMDERGRDASSELFAVEGVATETPAAERLGRTRGDKNIRRVRGTIRAVGDLHYQGRIGPKLASVTLDAP